MDDVIEWFLAHVPGFLRPAAGVIASLAKGTFNRITSFMEAHGISFSKLWTAAAYFRYGLPNFMREAYETARWLKGIWVPNYIEWLRRQVVDWVVGLINWAVNKGEAALSTLRAWAVGAINAGADLLRAWANWTLVHVNGLLADVRALRGALAHVLGGPSALAVWLVGAMWSVLWGYVDDNLDRLADALWARRQVIILRSISRLEALIARIL